MNFITTVLAFLLALGPLIIFHELGHYAVARLCGVKVLRFSVGMGKVVWSRRFGPDQTEWAVSALPLGGYVKMLDARETPGVEIDPADLKREFTSQSVWRRIAIVAAGPLANFILAIALLAALAMAGTSEPSTRVRAAAETSAAYQAGLRGGEKVVAVNGTPVASWPEMRWEILQAIVDKRDARLDVAQPQGGQFAAILPASKLAALNVESDVMAALGLEMALTRPVIEQVIAGGPGERAGLQTGDVIATVDGKPVADGMALIAAVRASQGRPLALAGERGAGGFAVTVAPVFDQKAKVWAIRVATSMIERVTITAGPLEAVAKGARKTWDTSVLSLKMIGKMITGEVSLKNVTGPITIADYAGQTARLGPEVFLGFIAFVSISLGVMNLLPIPMLDGGHLLYYSLEVLTGRPLPERIGAYAQRAGMGLLALLMALAVFNDLARLL
ncbi:RIP metalloprotease RseP [Massilia eurypsychrophila]|uniref:Zinc metalloprotease n=1 Tax=Massilia eurypsychrophila TaxID=1485217 RepID=A0A2G8TIK5_9BURK|nr:RIP metalloprotease RseP [Massilia eurypsychrophila]PIL45877.1 RIP metalloprotease RseP [Massilia eurypsychrophila]